MSGLIFKFLVLVLCSRSAPLAALNYEEAKIAVQKINKPALLTILSLDGDLIDCIDETKQPAFDHPLLKYHVLQNVPERRKKITRRRSKHHIHKVTQVWQRNGTRCPIGTVPIRRIEVDELMRAHSLSEFGKKQKSFNRQLVYDSKVNEHAIVSRKNVNGLGASAKLNVWNPKVDLDSEYSNAQIWITYGDETFFNSVEAGWHVFPWIKDEKTRIFTYWTNDGYNSNGCYNTVCGNGEGAFVQRSRNIVVGAALDSRISIPGGRQNVIEIKIRKDENGNWWMDFRGEPVGYWPHDLFNPTGGDTSTTIKWGGEVRNFGLNRHTMTEMGSGLPAEKGFRHASYFRKLQVQESLDGSFTPVLLSEVTPSMSKPGCYNIEQGQQEEFYYGGKGYDSSTCTA